jgi:hypothetical protein
MRFAFSPEIPFVFDILSYSSECDKTLNCIFKKMQDCNRKSFRSEIEEENRCKIPDPGRSGREMSGNTKCRIIGGYRF